MILSRVTALGETALVEAFQLEHSKEPGRCAFSLPLIVSFFCCIAAHSAFGFAVHIPDASGVVDKSKPKPASFSHPVWIKFEGPINYRTTQYLHAKLRRAEQLGADLIVVEINSPGGLANESLELAEQLSNINSAYTIAYVPNEAISGAALLSLGADEIVTASDARIGDIGVIEFDPSLFAFRFATAKIYSVLVRQGRDIASSKKHPPELVESMIDKDVLVYSKNGPNGEIEFTNRRIQEGKPAETTLNGGWTLIDESGPERFLTLSGVRAKTFGLVGHNVGSADELNRYLNVNGPYRRFEYSVTDTIVYLLNSPIITGLLIVIGLVALYIEFSARASAWED